MKFNWSCPECGMSSGTRYSVQRHIRNLHNSQIMPVSFVDYLAGRQGGHYPSGRKPTFRSKKELTIQEKIEQEAENVFVRRVAEAAFPPVGDKLYKEAADYYKENFRKRFGGSSGSNYFT